jgi:deazaflavin-dependent oxidoreductase (nitroreductase family)
MPKTAEEWRAFNRTVIADFRRHGGHLSTGRHPVILVTTTGAITGEPRVVPLNFSTDGERLVVIASNGGSPEHPAWYRNLAVNPIVTIEHDGDTFQARAVTAEEPERTRLFDAQAAVMSFFAGYRRNVKARQIPVVIFERIAARS